MVRLRIALGVASSLVAFAALTIVFSGTGEAQSVKATNVVVTNTPLPVTGNVTATISGSLSASIINPANNPVLVRDVDGSLWQQRESVFIDPGEPLGEMPFDPVPAGKALLVEHVSFMYENQGQPVAPYLVRVSNGQSEGQTLLPQPISQWHVAEAATKLYVRPGDHLRLYVNRINNPIGFALFEATVTGRLVNYP